MKGTLSARITNDVTKRSKNIRIAKSNLGASVFETIYENPALKAANVLEWPSEIKEKLTEGTYVIQMAVVSEDALPVAVLSFDQMKTTSLRQLINGSGVSDAIKLVLKCEEEDPNAPKLPGSDDMASPEKVETVSPETAPFTPDVAAETPNAAKRTPNTSTSRSGARIRITNTFTERSKNIRIGPSNLSDSIHDMIYDHPGIQASKILEWPAETEEALNTGLMEVQIFVEGTETTFSFAEMKSARVSELLDLVSDESVIPLSIRAVGIPQGEDGERNASADEEAKKADEGEARQKEEEKAFWAAEEANLLAKAEERKRQKEKKLKAILAAEEAAKQKAQEEANHKEAAIKAEEASRLARREAQKKAATEAEKSARMQAEEERKYREEQESNQHNEGVEMLQSKRRASVASEQLARSQAKSQRTMKREEDEEEAISMDFMLEADEAKDLDILESTAMLADDEMKELESKEDEEVAQSRDKRLENDELNELGGAESTAILAAEEVLELTQVEEARLRDAEEAHAMDAMLEAEEQQELVNIEQAEETAKGNRESSVILAADELAELMRKEEDVLVEYDRKIAEAAAKREAEYLAHREAEDVIHRSNEEELDRVLKAKEIEHEEYEQVEHERRENARMQALEERATVIQQEGLRPKKVDSPKDRTVPWEEPHKRKPGVEGRLQKVEQNFVPDASRKRSPDVVPLSLVFNVFLRKVRWALKHAKAYQGAREEMEAARFSVSKIEVFLGP
jgi:myosin heavy subunit